MARHINIGFQADKPVFVRIPLQARGKTLEVGQEFKWNELGTEINTVKILFQQGFLHHNEELETALQEKVAGDGLNEYGVPELQKLVEEINRKVREKTRTDLDYSRKKCKVSNIKDKQIGLIRSWRRNFGELE